VIVHSLASQAKRDSIEVVNLKNFMSVENFGSRSKLLHVTSIVLKCIAFLKKDPNVRKSGITAEYISLADRKWTQTIQANSFSSEWQRLFNGKDQIIVKQLLFLDKDKVIGCKGRINQSTLQLHSRIPFYYLPNTPSLLC